MKESWLLVYSTGKNSDKDEDLADQASYLLTNGGRYFGIDIDSPYFLSIKGKNLKDWTSAIESYENLKKIKLLVFMLDKKEENYYDGLKRFCFQKVKIPSQMIRKKTIMSNKLPIGGKIALQLNAKIGGIPWEISHSH